MTAHEIAHHWVGDLVTPVWWDDLWLNESFAEWSGIKIADQWRPDLGARTSLIADALGAMNVDSQRAGRPIRESIDDNTHISSTFDSITYEKGAGVLAMFESYLGEDVFQRGVHQHLEAHRHAQCDRPGFLRCARQSGRAARDCRCIPQLHRAGGCSAGNREHFLPTGISSSSHRLVIDRSARPSRPAANGRSRSVRPSFGPEKPQKRCTLTNGPSATLEVPDMKVAAVMPNAEGAGYYRFAMAPAAMDQLLGLDEIALSRRRTGTC